MITMTASADATPYELACVAYHHSQGLGIPDESRSTVTPEVVILANGGGQNLAAYRIQKDGSLLAISLIDISAPRLRKLKTATAR